MRLAERLPPFMAELLEFDCLTKAQQPEFTQAREELLALHGDFSLFTLTDYGCSRWERVMGIRARAASPTEERRKKILQIYLSHLPYTYRVLRYYLEETAPGYEALPDYANYRMQLRIGAEGQARHTELYGALRRMIPANIRLDYRYYMEGGSISAHIGAYTRITSRVTVRPYQPGDLEAAAGFCAMGGVRSGTRIKILSKGE